MDATFAPAPEPIAQDGPLSGCRTWLCTFTVMVDLPNTMGVADMEGLIAQAIANDFVSLGLPANVSAQLVATAGNCTVAKPTAGAIVATAVIPEAPV